MAGKKRRSTPKKQLAEERSMATSASQGSRLAGKVAVITGGNRGIGLAIARALLVEGCSVVITGRDREALGNAKAELDGLRTKLDSEPEVFAKRCDVSDPKSVASVFDLVKQRWGRLDVLINNAGISQAMVPIEATPVDVWKSVIDTNLTGTFLCSRAAIPLMQRGATMVNNLSLAVKSTFVNFAAYTASKHGAFGLTLTLRAELIPKGIRVVAIILGATDTGIWDQFWPDAPRQKMVTTESLAEAVLYAVLLPSAANLTELVLEPLEGVL